ncbi:TlpA family protein disulfide reductase [Chryseobacterium oryctis]|uniref:TlpA family protein disulfide reductase n=1 Tax=Chryseobacterium oryctis TaxID=2952618 RepID=A0ABT3HNZ8_9FLAO|nr:TlpA disulfide reductase family protein [Chryseobacterium oryctis]MCW3161474.1 TlpA family protein disulfide reductase [Chryseobacterium oryctis]
MKVFFIIFSLLFLGSEINAQNLEIGSKVPEISANTIQNESFVLSEVKKEVVLLDFWASWCAPCVLEQPELKEIYQKYSQEVQEGKFDIIGISLDKSKENWEKAVNKAQINWTQVSDLKFWKSPIAKAYFIQELPFNLIIDKEGKVIAKNLHGKDLEKFLESQFKK